MKSRLSVWVLDMYPSVDLSCSLPYLVQRATHGSRKGAFGVLDPLFAVLA